MGNIVVDITEKPVVGLMFSLAQSAKVAISIYNTKAELIRLLDLGYMKADYYIVYWDGKDSLGEKVASGTYFYILQMGNYSATKQMLVMKYPDMD